MNREVNRYLREVSRCLPCTRRTKKRIINQMRIDITRYMDENPIDDCRTFQNHFGTPMQIASAYVEEMDTKALLHDLILHQKISKMVAAGILAVVLLWGVAVSAALVKELTRPDSEISTNITIIE